MVTLSIVSDLQHYDSQLAEVDKMLEQMYKMLGCTLTTIPGVNVITAVKILAEIGDIKRFSNANKLAQFAGIAPLHLSSSGKGKDVATKQGNDDCRQLFISLQSRWCRYPQRIHREIRWYGHIMRNVRQREKPVSRH